MTAPEFSNPPQPVTSPPRTCPTKPRFLAHDDDIAAHGDDHRDRIDPNWRPDPKDLA